MEIGINIIIGIVAFLHLYFLWIEMFAWNTVGRRVFTSLPKDIFEKTKPMAANQGLYNGFLSAGLIWTYFISDPVWSANIALFFLGCVLVAGLYGAYSVDIKIFFIQGIPALLGIALILFS